MLRALDNIVVDNLPPLRMLIVITSFIKGGDVKYNILFVGICLCLISPVKSEEIILNCLHDSEIDQMEAYTNKGHGLDIQIGGTWGEDSAWLTKGLFQFERITIPGNIVFVDEAVLRFNIVGSDLGNAPQDIFQIAESWYEYDVTWDMSPGENRDVIVTEIPPIWEPPATLWEVDVTEIVQGWYGHEPLKAYGIYVDVPDNGISVDIDIASKDNPDTSLHPRLLIEYHTAGIEEEKEIFSNSLTVSDLTSRRVEMSFILHASSNVKVTVYDASGLLISTLTQDRYEKGFHKLCWNGSPGVFFIRFQTQDMCLTRKAVVIK
jgi:hypothetical protein